MENCLIVFDTNAYRKFIPIKSEEEAKKKISKLISLEKTNNIKALLSTDVAVELYSHLNDLNDPEYNRCKNSVIAQYLHCLDNNNPRYILNSDVHLCNIVFEKMPEFSVNEQCKILKMSGYLFKNYSDKYLKGYTKNFNEIRKFSLQNKEEFIAVLRKWAEPINKLYDKHNPPTYEEIIKIEKELINLRKELQSDVSINKIAFGLLKRAVNMLEIDINSLCENDKEWKIEIIKKQFLVPILFFRNILKSILDSNGSFNFEEPEKGNSLWDYQLTFQISNYINGQKIIFITDDKKFHTAAKEAGYQDRVIKLTEYLKDLNFNF